MSVFTEQDDSLFNKTLSLRERIIDNYSKLKDEELPRKASELTALTNLLESVDRTIIARAKVNIEDTQTKNDEKNKEMFLSLLKELHTNKQSHTLVIENNVEAPTYVPVGMSVSEGELVLRQDLITMEEN